MAEKQYLTAQNLLEDSYALARQILDSGFKPTFIVAIWRGGAPIGIAVQEFLAVHGIDSDHIAIRTSSYAAAIDQQQKEVKVHGLNYLVKNLEHHDRLLLVDDVYDTGRSIEAIIQELQRKTRLNMPEDVRVAVPYFKPSRNQTNRVPDYYLHETDAWLKYPHSLEGLSAEDIAVKRPRLYEIIKDFLPTEK
ncbi:phosphoribosyltransferase family protein [Psychromonas sp. 14N.309.X.WAT.B.A12]|uniref:phosphoribosyltransferase n=1 Tax=Psychromonas sp. 14N.309.X.WAT.B.A12 TaxID=2998322 RepID=UPI0025B21DAF|nr:phosphoribosyltransferase family protein [Psychromonas sp. 14N.309.X.WAT.B.A12]MDN2663565.1 phosphoribosyltransferase family protein [Psychromonas sp. 14N.309.X.WAT.B.A12]